MSQFVYFLRPVGAAGPIKIGHSQSPYERLKTYMAWSPVPLELVAMTPGGDDLEHRLHAHFAHLHSHHEWFQAAPELTALIETVLTGLFDAENLPAPRRVHQMRKRSHEATAAAVAARDFNLLAKFGVKPPEEGWGIWNTYQCSPQETSRRRAIVRAFVEAHAGTIPAARKAAHAQWRRDREQWQARLAAAAKAADAEREVFAA